jgi:hypothetical protein
MPIPKPEKKKTAPQSASRHKKDYAVIFARSKARKALRHQKLLAKAAARRPAAEG